MDQNNGQKQEGDLVCAYRRNNVAVDKVLSVVDPPEDSYCGLSLRSIEYDGILRYYYIYLPESVRDSDKKVQAVMAMPGKSNCYTDYLYSSGRMNIADDEGIIVVFPLASPDISVSVNGVYTALSWGRRDDTNFLQTAVVRDILEKDPVDASCVYAFDHSSGCCIALAQAIAPEVRANSLLPLREPAVGSDTGLLSASLPVRKPATQGRPVYSAGRKGRGRICHV